MYPKEEDVVGIIHKMDSLSVSEKEHLTATFDALSKRQKRLFSELKDGVKSELSATLPEKIDVYTVLVEEKYRNLMNEFHFCEMSSENLPLKNEKLEKNFGKEVLQGQEQSLGLVFWNKNFEQIEEIVSESYQADLWIGDKKFETKFYLKPNFIFVQKEKELFRLSMQYNFHDPIIYNPMGRRCLEVLFKIPMDIPKDSKVSIDLKFSENQLKESLLLNHHLYWNVKIEGSDTLSSPKKIDSKEVFPLWDRKFSTYKFSSYTEKKGCKEYLLMDDNLRIMKRVGNDIYWQLTDSVDPSFEKFSIYAIDEIILKKLRSECCFLFHNDFKETVMGDIQRVRTKGDVRRCLASFEELDISCKEIYVEREYKGREVIHTSKKYEYYSLKDDRLREPHGCMIVFDRKEDAYFLDKVYYILGYLNHYYPEYQWIGGR